MQNNELNENIIESADGSEFKRNFKFTGFAGLLNFYNVPVNCCLVQEKLSNGSLVVKTSGYRFKFPFRRAYIVSLSNFVVAEESDESINSPVFKDGEPTGETQEITVRRFTYDCSIYAPSGKNNNGVNFINTYGIRKFYSEQNAYVSAKNRIKQLIIRIVQQTDYEILKTLNFSLDNIPRYLSPRVRADIKNTLESVRRDFGFNVSNVDLGDVNLTQNIREALDNARAERINNDTRIAQAEANKRVAKLQAEGRTFDEQVIFNILASSAKELGITPEQITDILKRHVSAQANSTFIDSNSGNKIEDLLATLISSSNSNDLYKGKRFKTFDSKDDDLDNDGYEQDEEYNKRGRRF